MASPRPPAPAVEAHKSFYEKLRYMDGEIDALEGEIDRLMEAKMIRFPEKFEEAEYSGRRCRQYQRKGFGGQVPQDSQWWERAIRRNLFDSVENLDRELETANVSKTNLEERRNRLRRRMNTASRPFLGNVGILDLPDELLIRIFELMDNAPRTPEFSDFMPFRKNFDRNDITNSRLVCQRFCSLSSELLLPLVLVRCNKASLARLEDISRHATISKGVRVVQVVLNFYNHSFSDFTTFVLYHAGTAEDELTAAEKRFSTCDSEEAPMKLETIAKKRAALATVRRLVSADADNDGGYVDGDQVSRKQLDETHQQYLALLEEQTSLLKGGEFSRCVSSAIARMHRARTVFFDDHWNMALKPSQLMIPDANFWSAVHSNALQPMPGHRPIPGLESDILELPSYECIINVLDAVREAGVHLTGIDIDLEILGSPGSLALGTPETRHTFSSGMQQLQVFRFKSADDLDSQAVDQLHEFLSCCLDTDSLQKLHVEMGRSKNEPPSPTIELGAIMGTRQRPRLTELSVGGVCVHLPQLVLLLQRLPESIESLYHERVHLRSGTWREALDALRRKKCGVQMLRQPHGADCDGMPWNKYRMIFSEPSTAPWLSQAELWISNRSTFDRNPLEDVEDELDTAT